MTRPSSSPTTDRTGTVTSIIPRRQLAAASAGQLIEWFDWNAYALLTIYFASQFFPEGTSPLVSLLGSFGIMAVGFLFRPLAGLIVGKIADQFGRRFAMMLTVYGMGAAALMMAFAPTYAQTGILAPIILLLARIIQGICIGGEYAAMTAFAMEMAPQGKRGFVAGVLNFFSFAGQFTVALLVVIASWTFSEQQMTDFGWRLIFVIGALLSVGGIFIRRGMQETTDVEKEKKRGFSVFEAIRKNPGATVRVIGMTMGFTVMVYTWGTYMPAYAQTYKGLDPKYGMLATLISLTVAAFASLGAGWLSDRLGRKATMLTAGLVLMVGTVPAMGFLDDSLWKLIVLQGIANIVLMLLQASAMPAFAELFPRSFRASGLGFPYSLTVGLIGGTAPMVGTLFADLGFMQAFPWYLTGLMAISVVFYATMKETAFAPLPE